MKAKHRHVSYKPDEAENQAKQQKLDSFLGIVSSSSRVLPQKQLNEGVVRLIYGTNLPLTLVRNPEFISFIHLLQPDRTLPCYKTVLKMMTEQFDELCQNLRDIFAKCDVIAVSADGWSGGGNRGFLGVSATWLDQDLNRKNADIACRRMKGCHNFEALAATLEQILVDFLIHNKTTTATTDNARNFEKCFRLFGRKELPNFGTEHVAEDEPIDGMDDELQPIQINDLWDEAEENELEFNLPKHFRCAAHTINLVATKDIEPALSCKVYKKSFRSFESKARGLWNAQGQSQVKSDVIRDMAPKMFKTPNVTRWNSVYDSVSTLLAIADSCDINEIMDKSGLPRFTQDDMKFAKEYQQVMKPLAEGLDRLQGEKDICLGYLLPTLLAIKKHILKKQESLIYCQALADAIINGLDKRFLALFDSKDHVLASVLVPQFKLYWIESSTLRDQAKSWLKEELNAHQSNSEVENVHKASDPFFDLTYDDENESYGIESILNKYLTDPDRSMSAIKQHPLLVKLFIKFNTALPSSANTERLFSAAGDTFAKKRASMTDTNFEMKLLLKVNKGLCL